jgi:hypothetical protein
MTMSRQIAGLPRYIAKIGEPKAHDKATQPGNFRLG